MNLENLRLAKNLVHQLIASHEIIEEKNFSFINLTDEEGMSVITARIALLEKQLRETGFVAAVKPVESFRMSPELVAVQ